SRAWVDALHQRQRHRALQESSACHHVCAPRISDESCQLMTVGWAEPGACSGEAQRRTVARKCWASADEAGVSPTYDPACPRNNVGFRAATSITSSPNSELAQANHARVKCEGSSW